MESAYNGDLGINWFSNVPVLALYQFSRRVFHAFNFIVLESVFAWYSRLGQFSFFLSVLAGLPMCHTRVLSLAVLNYAQLNFEKCQFVFRQRPAHLSLTCELLLKKRLRSLEIIVQVFIFFLAHPHTFSDVPTFVFFGQFENKSELFFVFMWRHRFPKLQISNPTNVLVSSDI